MPKDDYENPNTGRLRSGAATASTHVAQSETVADHPLTSDWEAEWNRRMYWSQLYAGMKPTYEAEWPHNPLPRDPQKTHDARITVEVWPDRTSCRFEFSKGQTFAEGLKHVIKARDAVTAEIEGRSGCPAAKKSSEADLSRNHLRAALEWMRDRDDENGSLPEAYRKKVDDALAERGVRPTEATW